MFKHHSQKISRLVLATFCLVFLAQCGKEGKSSLVSFSVSPEKPIVITADTKIGGDEIKGPWFGFRVKAANDSEDTVTIVAVEIKVKITDELGSEKTFDDAFSPGEEDTSIEVGGVQMDCRYYVFAEIPPGESADLEWDNDNFPDLNDTNCPEPFGFLAHGLPKVKNNFRYTVEMRPVGWFGSYLNPTDRFERIVTFFTQ